MRRYLTRAFGLWLLSVTANGMAAEFPLVATFDDKTPGSTIGTGGAALGEPTELGNLDAVIEAVGPGQNRLLVSNDLSSTAARRLRWQLLDNQEIVTGEARISMDLTPSTLDRYSILVREANSSAQNFLNLQFNGDGTITGNDVNGTLTLTNNLYTAGTPVHIEINFDLDAGTSAVTFNGLTLMSGRQHGVVGHGIGRVSIGYASSSSGSAFTLDNVMVEARPPARAVLSADFENQTPGAAIGNGGASAGEPMLISASMLTEIVATGAANGNVLDMESSNFASAQFLAWQWLDNIEVRSGIVVIEHQVLLESMDRYSFSVRESGSNAMEFSTFRLLPSGGATITDVSGTQTLGGFSYTTNQVYLLRFEFNMDLGTYSVFWDDTPIVTDRAHGVVNGRGIGRYLTTISNPSTNGGPMSIDNLLVTATEAEPIPAVLAFLNQPTQGNPGQVLSPSAEVAVVNAFDEPIIDGTTVTLEIASGPTAQLSGASATTTNGVAHFDTLRIDTPGIYQLRARSGDATVVAGTILTINALPIPIFASGFEGNAQIAIMRSPH